MKRLRVADHVFELVSQTTDKVFSISGNYKPFVDQSSDNLLFRVVVDCVITPRFDEPTLVFDYDLSEGNCSLKIYPDEYRLTIFPPSSERPVTIVCPFAENSETQAFSSDIFVGDELLSHNTLDHLLVFAFSFATFRHKTLLIHSSVIVVNDKATMFLGESGTGKSTHTQLWLDNIEGANLLNDDGPVVRVFEYKTIVYGSPWSGKTPCYKSESYCVVGFVRLRQAPFNKIVKLNAIGGFGALLPSCLPTLQKEERVLDFVCDTLSELLVVTPTYTLDCLPNVDAAKTSYERVFGGRGGAVSFVLWLSRPAIGLHLKK